MIYIINRQSLPGHFLCSFFCLVVLLIGCTTTDKKVLPLLSNDEAILLCKKLIVQKKLTSVSIDCITFGIANRNRMFLLIHVREMHGMGCPGDPGTSPRLFSFQINLHTREVLTDAYSLDGSFQQLKEIVTDKLR